MALSARDIEQISRKERKESFLRKAVFVLIKFLMRIPPLRRCIENTLGGFHGRILLCLRTKDYRGALRIAHAALAKYQRNADPMAHHHWWSFMKDAVKAADSLVAHHYWWSFMKDAVKAADSLGDRAEQERLIGIGLNGIRPFEGYYVACCFNEFSRWRYMDNDLEGAIAFAERAAKSDPTWGEPDFRLGWYGLFNDTVDSLLYFRRAVEKDRRFLERIANDPECKRRPHVIAELKGSFGVDRIHITLN